MNIPKIHSNLIWDLIALVLLLTIGYWTILYIFKNYPLLGGNLRENKRKQLVGIIGRLIRYDQGKLKMSEKEHIELKVELWKLLRKSSNKRIASSILGEMDSYLDKGGIQIIHRLSKEFGLQLDALDSTDVHGKAQVYKTNSFDTKPDLLNGEELDFNFVPIVTNYGDTDNGSGEDIREEPMFGSDMECPTESLDWESFERNPYEAIHEEIYGDNKMHPSNRSPKPETSFLNIDFLPLILEIEEGKETPSTDLNDLDVEYEVVLDPHFKKQISDILMSHLEEENRKAVPQEDNNLLDLGEMNLPAAKFYTDSEFKKVKLLHSIAEMGDMREVPLLNEMLDGEENESIGNLIKEIIFKFLYHYPMDIDEQDNDNSIVDFGEHYVFNHLFGSLDIESQLLLLQEIQQIGDISDLYFLKTLHNHSNKTIGEKAKLVSRCIEAKFHSILTGDTQILSSHNMDPNKEISGPSNLPRDPWITFEVAKSGFISTISSERENMKADRITPFNYYETPPDNEEENMGNNDDLFNIDFDITSLGNIKQNNSNSHKKEESAADWEEMKFLDQLKALTDKIFKK
ncbi:MULTISPECIES: hypothetical protein [unclassified Arenibacter]|uniref:hypothetical protein n=1 Tax=unclassified Arenibacter TaxID=2615047 RepID=UPI000E3523C4|nr:MULTISPECIES: hypothetical protein [unclassified Arenibacter]MCM4163157.1 hypothetical protein [Arenibacter sp. A80]RFT57184.1 hypothetical protein D0S24_06065 [Arenibacter sp. P308M17]